MCPEDYEEIHLILEDGRVVPFCQMKTEDQDTQTDLPDCDDFRGLYQYAIEESFSTKYNRKVNVSNPQDLTALATVVADYYKEKQVAGITCNAIPSKEDKDEEKEKEKVEPDFPLKPKVPTIADFPYDWKTNPNPPKPPPPPGGGGGGGGLGIPGLVLTFPGLPGITIYESEDNDTQPPDVNFPPWGIPNPNPPVTKYKIKKVYVDVFQYIRSTITNPTTLNEFPIVLYNLPSPCILEDFNPSNFLYKIIVITVPFSRQVVL